MKKTILALSLAALSVPALAQGKKPESDFTFSGNMSINSDYRFRGISQTRGQPALQGGFDLSHSSGLYLGNWNSNVSSAQYLDGAGLEMDLYGGYKTELFGVGLDVGFISYTYPGANIRTTGSSGTSTKLGKYDNQEVYLGVSYGPFSLKTFYSTSDYFGLKGTTDEALGAEAKGPSVSSRGTTYIDLTFSKEIFDKTTIVAHYGQTSVANWDKLNYSDTKLGISYDLDGWILGLSYIATSGMNTTYRNSFYTNVGDHATSKPLYKSATLLSLSKTF